MNKKIIGIFICMLLLMTIPVSASHDDSKDNPTGPLTKTTVRGIVCLVHTQEGILKDTTSFLAIRVKYTTSSLLGEDVSGTLILKRVTFKGKFTRSVFYL